LLSVREVEGGREEGRKGRAVYVLGKVDEEVEVGEFGQ